MLQAQPLEAKQLVRGGRVGSAEWSHHQQFIGYGYMDEHKKSMIQQWVECQAAQAQTTSPRHAASPQPQKMIPVKAPPSMSKPEDDNEGDEEKPEPFAWLKKQSAEGGECEGESGCCRALTQFKTVETSGSSEEGFESSNNSNRIICADVHEMGKKTKAAEDDDEEEEANEEKGEKFDEGSFAIQREEVSDDCGGVGQRRPSALIRPAANEEEEEKKTLGQKVPPSSAFSAKEVSMTECKKSPTKNVGTNTKAAADSPSNGKSAKFIALVFSPLRQLFLLISDSPCCQIEILSS